MTIEEYTKMHIMADISDVRLYFCVECQHNHAEDWATEPCKSCELKRPTKFEEEDRN